MSKIVQAVNAMISNPRYIINVTAANEELFFLYKGKYIWSMRKDDDEYILWFYPSGDMEELMIRSNNGNWEGVQMVTYKTSEIGTKEGRNSFAELYTLLTEREFGLNDVLEDIISDGDPF